jgi:hypothetical protein
VDTIILNASRDLPLSRNQPLKSADEEYTRILKNQNPFVLDKIIKEARRLDTVIRIM